MTEINQTLELTSDQFVYLVKALRAYNATVDAANKIELNDITVKPEISGTSVIFAINKNTNYTENIVYKLSNGSISKVYKIGEQTFNVPPKATIAVADGKITISYAVNSTTTKTIELSKAGEDSTYFDKVKYNNGSLEDITDNAVVTIREDGVISK